MTRDLAAVMITVDRSPGRNYLAETLDNLERSDLLTSERLHSLTLVDSGPDCTWAHRNAFHRMRVHAIGPMPFAVRPANMNVASALRAALGTKAPWIVFLEDDIDVCARFFDSTGKWLDEHTRDDVHIYSLAANYGWVQEALETGRSAAKYLINQFYGTQALALRSEDAGSLADYLEIHCFDRTEDGTAYDLLIADWSRVRWPSSDFLAACPAFVQHIGRSSTIRPRAETHIFPSWPGRDWTYKEA